MSIEIQLSGCEERVRKACDEFDHAVSEHFLRSPGELQTITKRYFNGKSGYLRSSYNPRGFFPLLELVFGFDVAAFLFPGDWNLPILIDGQAFLRKVECLRQTARLGELRQAPVPWIAIFTELTQEVPTGAHPNHLSGQLGADEMQAALRDTLGEPPALGIPNNTRIEHIDLWPMLDDLENFGKVAAEINANGEPTTAKVSY